jgi:ABC-type lipoprotein export system ATPase subunit
LVTHDASLTARADRIVTLRDGSVVSDELRQPVEAVRGDRA